MRETAGRPRFSWRQRLLVVVLGALIGALQFTTTQTYQDLSRTIRWFGSATENMTGLYNTHRETLKLALAVERLQLPDGLDEVELHRSLLDRQVQVALGLSKEPEQQRGLAQIRGTLGAFDAEFALLRTPPTGAQLALSRPTLRQHADEAERIVKSLYDHSEIGFTGSAVEVINAQTGLQRLLLWMSGLTLTVGLVLAVSLRRRANRAYSRAYIQLVAEVDERKRLAEQLRHQAYHDPLTGLPNRALLRDRAVEAIRGADRTLAPACVAGSRAYACPAA